MKRLALLLTLLLAGCGLGAGEDAGEVHVAITQDYGATAVGEPTTETVREDETLLKLLERTHDLETGFGGAFIESFGGVKSGSGKEWIFYVNGMEATKGAADVTLRPDDRVWWDLHAWSEGVRVPAVVASFPQPFVGRATRVECAAAAATCEAVRARLTAAGAKLTEAADRAVRVVVGPLDGAPDGTFVNERLELLDAGGKPRDALPAGGGLVAATAEPGKLPTWFVTGTDEAGIALAAEALTQQRLANRVALAITPDGDVALPVR